MPNKPSDGMKTEAARGLARRREFGRGGTEVGIARARDISGGKNLSDDTVKRMLVLRTVKLSFAASRCAWSVRCCCCFVHSSACAFIKAWVD